MAWTGQNANYTSSVKYAAATAWATGAAKAVGALVRETAPTANNERIWVCIIAGTTHATTEPTWTTADGELLVSGPRHLHGLADLASQNGGFDGDTGSVLAAETPTGEGHDHPDLFLIEIQRCCDL